MLKKKAVSEPGQGLSCLNCFIHLFRNFAHLGSVFVSMTGYIFLWVSRYIACVGFFPSFHFEYLIEFQKMTGVLQHFFSWFSFISWITVLISMLTSLICAGVESSNQVFITASRTPSVQRSSGHETARPSWASFAPGATQRVGQPEAKRLACCAQQQMQWQM